MENYVQQGAWIIAAYKVISKYNLDNAVFDPFEAAIIAARSGEMFSAIRALGSIEGQKFEAYRKLCKLKRSNATTVLRFAKNLGGGLGYHGWKMIRVILRRASRFSIGKPDAFAVDEEDLMIPGALFWKWFEVE
jgi:hypothetical protein